MLNCLLGSPVAGVKSNMGDTVGFCQVKDRLLEEKLIFFFKAFHFCLPSIFSVVFVALIAASAVILSTK